MYAACEAQVDALRAQANKIELQAPKTTHSPFSRPKDLDTPYHAPEARSFTSRFKPITLAQEPGPLRPVPRQT